MTKTPRLIQGLA